MNYRRFRSPRLYRPSVSASTNIICATRLMEICSYADENVKHESALINTGCAFFLVAWPEESVVVFVVSMLVALLEHIHCISQHARRVVSRLACSLHAPRVQSPSSYDDLRRLAFRKRTVLVLSSASNLQSSRLCNETNSSCLPDPLSCPTVPRQTHGAALQSHR